MADPLTEDEARARLRLIQIKKEKLALKRDDNLGVPPIEVEGEGLDLQDVRGFGGALLKGMGAGFGDEFVGAARTGMEMLNPANYGEGTQDFSDTYAMYRDDARASDKEFERENAGTALAANLVGGIASPLNKIAPGFGTSRAGMAGRGAIEGGLAGYGESEADTLGGVARDIGKGTLFGGGVAGGLGVGGHLFKKTRGIEKLDQIVDGAKRFKPLQLAADDDSLAGRIYRNTFGRSSGGGKLSRQEQPWLDDAADAVETERLGLAGRKQALDEAATLDTADAANVVRGDKRVLAENVRQETLNMDNQIDNLEQLELKPKTAVPKLPKAAKAAGIDARTAEPTVKFRRDAAVESIPARERQQVFTDPNGGTIDIDNTEMVDDMIYDFWQSDDAFRMVKEATFNLDDSPDLRRFVTDVMETPESRSQLGEVVTAAKKRAKAEGFDMKIVDGVTEEGEDIIRKMDDDEILEWAFSGDIDGTVLMELRNIYARGANSASGMSRGAQRKVASAFDKYIVKNIDDADEYFEHIEAYPNSITHGKAVAGNKANAAGGKFTIDEHQAAGKPLARRGTDKPGQRSKKRPMQPQAREGRAALEALEPPPSALPDATAANAAREANVAADAANAGTKAQTKRLRKTLRSELSDRTGQKRAQITDDAADAATERAIATARGKAALTEEAKTGPLGQASARARELAAKATPKGASGLSERLTDVMIGSAITPKATPFLGKLAAGVGGALGGTTKTVQRRIAGQGWEQKAAQAVMKALRGATKEEQIAEMIARGVSRQVALQAVGD